MHPARRKLMLLDTVSELFADVAPEAQVLRLDGEFVTVVGDTVHAFDDLADNSNVVEQSSDPLRPSLAPDLVAGRDGALFNGTSQFMSASGLNESASSQGMCVLVIEDVDEITTAREAVWDFRGSGISILGPYNNGRFAYYNGSSWFEAAEASVAGVQAHWLKVDTVASSHEMKRCRLSAFDELTLPAYSGLFSTLQNTSAGAIYRHATVSTTFRGGSLIALVAWFGAAAGLPAFSDVAPGLQALGFQVE